ncbi:MAG TPA: hypothetical protein VHB97_09070 [Polyangia bacterium]|jgi:hypothetical protein|nr:hypothetical protein [Polyangia bacterium]
MLAELNPKIVAELQTLALSWQAVALDAGATSSPKPPRGRKRKPKPKS